jgi:hypothetical protein
MLKSSLIKSEMRIECTNYPDVGRSLYMNGK